MQWRRGSMPGSLRRRSEPGSSTWTLGRIGNPRNRPLSSSGRTPWVPPQLGAAMWVRAAANANPWEPWGAVTRAELQDRERVRLTSPVTSWRAAAWFCTPGSRWPAMEGSRWLFTSKRFCGIILRAQMRFGLQVKKFWSHLAVNTHDHHSSWWVRLECGNATCGKHLKVLEILREEHWSFVQAYMTAQRIRIKAYLITRMIRSGADAC